MKSALIEKLTSLAGESSLGKPQAMSTISLRLRKNPDTVTQILSATSFLDRSAKISERIHCVLNGVTAKPKCERCERPVKFANGHYRRFCSQRCSANAGTTRVKCAQTTIEKYGCGNVFQNSDIKSKIKETNLARYGTPNTWALAAHGKFSRVSEDLFDHLKPHLTVNGKYGVDEQRVSTPLGVFKLDFYVEHETGCKAIEFFGDYWHANPKMYDANDVIKGKIVQSIWEHDRERLQAIRNAGVDVLVIWETDFKEDPEEVLDLCIAFIEGY